MNLVDNFLFSMAPKIGFNFSCRLTMVMMLETLAQIFFLISLFFLCSFVEGVFFCRPFSAYRILSDIELQLLGLSSVNFTRHKHDL